MITVTGISGASTQAPTVPAARNPLAARRLIRKVVGLVLVVGSVGTICVGVFAALASTGATSVDLGAHGSYRSDRYGLATDETNWASTWFGWAGSVRLQVASTSNQPIFVGVAEPHAISRFLAGTGYTTISAHPGHGVVGIQRNGTSPPAPSAIRWTAHAEGTGTQTLRWNAKDGPQVVFAMNADRSRVVNVRIMSSKITLDRMPWWIPAALLGSGIIALPIGIALLVRRL